MKKEKSEEEKQRKHEASGKVTLTPYMNEEYDEWKKTACRRIARADRR